jgi:hypothetical protein
MVCRTWWWECQYERVCMLVTHTVNKIGETTGTTMPTCQDVKMWLTRTLCKSSHPTNQLEVTDGEDLAPGASWLPRLRSSHCNIQNAVWIAVTTPCQDLRLVVHHDLCPLWTRISVQPASIRQSIHWKTWSTNIRTWSDLRQMWRLCTNTFQQTPWALLQASWRAVGPLILLDCATILSMKRFTWWEEGGQRKKAASQIYRCLTQ